jgi:Domain of unknown function (DUF4181)
LKLLHELSVYNIEYWEYIEDSKCKFRSIGGFVMYVYGTEPAVGARLALLVAIVLLLLFSFNILARKWFKVEKKKLFSYNHVNEKHKKIDWIIRLSSMASIR